MPVPFIIPFLLGIGVGATGAMAYMSSRDPKPTVVKKGSVTHIVPKKRPPGEG